MEHGQQWSNGAGVQVETRYVSTSELWELWITGSGLLLGQRRQPEVTAWLQGNGFTPVGE